MNSSPTGRRQIWLVCLLLAFLVPAAYWPALNCGFVDFDDPDYITANPEISGGLTPQFAAWAFRSGQADNWHPLTWLSHALDVTFFGINPRGHHAVNIAWHTVNSILLFLLLRELTGALWPSAVVAGLFAFHPMHVESVAWVSERKDLLSTFFWLLSVWAYARRARDFKSQISNFKFYGLSLLFFALGLMSKPMVVTLPFVLLLLDYWPLGRVTGEPGQTVGRLFLEKWPFFLLSIASCVITFLVQKHAGVVSSLTKITLGARLDNLPVAYQRYLFKTFWPLHLAAFYPHPRFWPLWRLLAALALLAGITALVICRRKKEPWLPVGWFWFLGMLVPVIGLVQVGNQSMADRYGYLSIVGIFIMVVWSARHWAAWIAVVPVIAACAVLTWRQTHFWHDTVTLFVHTSEITADNSDAFYQLGRYWQHNGDNAKAAGYYARSLQIDPNFPEAHNNLGYIRLQEGKTSQAMEQFQRAIGLKTNYPEAEYNLGRAYMSNGQPAEAAARFQQAAALDPNIAAIHFSLAEALRAQGLIPAAEAEEKKALQLRGK